MKRLTAAFCLIMLMLLSMISVSAQTTAEAEYVVKAQTSETGGKIETVYSVVCQRTDHPIYAVQIMIPYDGEAMKVEEVTFGGKFKSNWQYNDTGSQLIALFLSSDMKENAVTAGEEIMTFTVTSEAQGDSAFFRKWQIDSGSFDANVLEMTSRVQFPDGTEVEMVPGESSTDNGETGEEGTGEGGSAAGSQAESGKSQSHSSGNEAAGESGETAQNGDTTDKTESGELAPENSMSGENSEGEGLSPESAVDAQSQNVPYGLLIGTGVLLILLCVAGIWLYRRRKMK